MRRADRRAGFTLIEVLAALAITTAIMAVVMPFAGRLATRWWAGEMAVETADAWMQAIGRMSDDLAQAMPLGFGPAGRPELAFKGGPDGFALVRPALGRAPGATDLESVSYAVETTAAGEALVRRSRRFDASVFAADPMAGTAVVLIDGPFRFRLVTVGDDGTRRRGWDAPDSLPAAIELSTVATGREPVPVAPIVMAVVARRPPVDKKPPGS